MLFTIVKAVPFDSLSTLFATSVENNGESAITTIPHTIRYVIKIILLPEINIKGEIRQHKHESMSAEKAVILVPNFSDI